MNLDHAMERIHQLETLLGLNLHFPGFTGSEQRMMGLFLRKGMATKENLYDALYGDRPDADTPDPKTMDVLLCKLRKKLRVHDITIATWWGVGYRIEAADRERLKLLSVGGASA